MQMHHDTIILTKSSMLLSLLYVSKRPVLTNCNEKYCNLLSKRQLLYRFKPLFNMVLPVHAPVQILFPPVTSVSARQDSRTR